ncbi:hypothetical protein [Nocardia jinanensis]|uniref:Uncharacterized protein n=1 Tax=Nocardia jinanensis TaxID=382504 RepID=A0A917VUA5_9NOCA|nr:hypothetical protein [Nocardia jinanensis]GGL19202.1 hypothetical protein GCM10011588_37240 [Nocardia jinanensis]
MTASAHGSVRNLLGEKIVRLDRGDFLTVPPTLAHAFALLERVHRGAAGVEEIRASSELYDNHYVDSPVRRDELAGM